MVLFEDKRFLLFFIVITSSVILIPRLFLREDKTKNVPIVKAPAGDVSGIETESRDGRGIFAYRGIPYAQPPVGKLRFLRPQPFTSRNPKVHDGSQFSSPCMHPFTIGRYSFKMGSEDCLTLNVNKPKEAQKELLPVMVWIHGGGFVNGDSSDNFYGPNNILDRDVVLVTIQYRLGSLGFFSLGNEEVAGNQGLWDQRQALLWVQKNIESFGGDPNKVTIFGESAGGIAVSSHLMSEASKGLFHRAIVQSGPLHNSFMMSDTASAETSLPNLHSQYAAASGCSSENPKETLNCLQSLPAEKFLDNLKMFDECSTFSEAMTFPGVWKPQKDFSFSSKPFFSSDYITAVSSGKFASDVPVMIGFNREDGLLNVAHISKRPEIVKQLGDDWEKCHINNMFGRRFDEQTPQLKMLSARVTNFYLKDIDEINFQKDLIDLTNMFTDPTFGQGSNILVKTFEKTQKSPIFFYRLDHLGTFSMGDVFSSDILELLKMIILRAFDQPATKGMGVCHADDLLYLFSQHLTFLGPEDLPMSKAMVDMWVNFAQHGNPTPKQGDKFIGDGLQGLENAWPKAGTKGRKCDYVRLENAQVILDCDEKLDERFVLWEEIMRELKL